MRVKAFEKFSAPSQEDSSALRASPTETGPPSDLAQVARIQGQLLAQAIPGHNFYISKLQIFNSFFKFSLSHSLI